MNLQRRYIPIDSCVRRLIEQQGENFLAEIPVKPFREFQVSFHDILIDLENVGLITAKGHTPQGHFIKKDS